MEREFFAGFIKIHILFHAVHDKEICGVEIARELATHGYSVSPGTLYPTLHRLEERGYLESFERVTGGHVRRYYRATPAGREALAAARKKIRELVEEVIEGKRH
jgi:PadR family transcriptional regulator